MLFCLVFFLIAGSKLHFETFVFLCLLTVAFPNRIWEREWKYSITNKWKPEKNISLVNPDGFVKSPVLSCWAESKHWVITLFTVSFDYAQDDSYLFLRMLRIKKLVIKIIKQTKIKKCGGINKMLRGKYFCGIIY